MGLDEKLSSTGVAIALSRRFALSKKSPKSRRVALELLESLQDLSAYGVVPRADMARARALCLKDAARKLRRTGGCGPSLSS